MRFCSSRAASSGCSSSTFSRIRNRRFSISSTIWRCSLCISLGSSSICNSIRWRISSSSSAPRVCQLSKCSLIPSSESRSISGIWCRCSMIAWVACSSSWTVSSPKAHANSSRVSSSSAGRWEWLRSSASFFSDSGISRLYGLCIPASLSAARMVLRTQPSLIRWPIPRVRIWSLSEEECSVI